MFDVKASIILLIFVFSSGWSKFSTGTLQSASNFAYLDRFCFQSESGFLEYEFYYPSYLAVHSLLLYYDTEDQWPQAYKKLQSCDDRVQLLVNQSREGQIIRLSPFELYDSRKRCVPVHDNLSGTEYIKCTGTRTFSSRRSRWWFLAIATCNTEDIDYRDLDIPESGSNGSSTIKNNIQIMYKLKMTNGLPTDILHYEFSDDEWLILPVDIGFLILNVALLIINCAVGHHLMTRRLFHTTYKWSTHVLIQDTFGLIALTIHYSFYAQDGQGHTLLKNFGQLLRGIAQILFVSIILLLSSGWNVARMKLKANETLSLVLIVLCYFFSALLALIWEIWGFDPALVYYQSESIAGYSVAACRLLAWLFFLVGSYKTLKAFPNKKKFYTSFLWLYTPWFYAGPIFLGIANFVLDNWVREEVMNFVDNCVTSYGFVVFMYLSWPSSNNENFPFHIRTSQVSNCDFNPHEHYASEKPVDAHISSVRPQIDTENDTQPPGMGDD